MGVLNVTPDSFSDGGEFNDLNSAVTRALEIEAEGANVIDIGGESTRPGSQAISIEEETARVIPVIERLRGRLNIPISVDTTKSAIARAAINSGAEIINDVSGLRFDPSLAQVAAETGAGLVLMHSRGTPENMQRLPPVQDIFLEVRRDWRRAIDLALGSGVAPDKLILDPGVGFGKTPEQNLQLIYRLDSLAEGFDYPILLGPSRKSFIKRILDQRLSARKRDDRRERFAGTAASVTIGVLRGARMIRVHDVAEMTAVIRLTETMIENG